MPEPMTFEEWYGHTEGRLKAKTLCRAMRECWDDAQAQCAAGPWMPIEPTKAYPDGTVVGNQHRIAVSGPALGEDLMRFPFGWTHVAMLRPAEGG